MTDEFKKYSAIFIFAAFLVFVMWVFGHSQLGGFDMSALVDTGWRMANGQIPYVEFPLTTPVAFYIGAGWAIQLFGSAWSSFVIAAIIFAVLAFLVQTYLLNLIIPWKPAVAISFVCQLLCSVVISYWWYNAITMTSACLFLTAAYVFAARPTDRVSWVSLWATLTLLSLMKPNIAGSLSVLVILCMFLTLPHRRRIFLICVGSLLSFVLILFLLKISPLSVIQSYIDVGRGRAMPTIKWFFNDKGSEYLAVIPLLMLCLLVLAEGINGIKAALGHVIPVIRTYLFLTLISIAVGIISLVTNSDSNLVIGLPFFLLSTAIFCFFTKPMSVQPASQQIWKIVTVTCMIYVLIGCVIIQARYHSYDSAPNMTSFWFITAIVVELAVILFLLMDAFYKKRNFSANQFGPNSLMWIVLLVCGSVALFAGGMRWRVLYIGVDSFFSYSPLVEMEDIPFFERFQISSSAKNTLLEIQDVLIQHYGSRENWLDSSIYFGPRIEFAYAAFGVPSPLNLPIWWHPDNSYPKSDAEEFAQSFLSHNFEICIFMKMPGQKIPDMGFLPDVVVESLHTDYREVQYPNIVVYYPK